MLRLQHQGWTNSVAWINEAALEKAASGTLIFTKELFKSTEPSKDTRFAKIIQKGASYLLKSITSVGDRRLQYELDLEQACFTFLRIATDIESLLMDLLLEEEKVLYELGQEEVLSLEMERMKLGSVIHPINT
jgi:hypothetical protein